MARKVLECRGMFPDSNCTLIFIGEPDEVLKAFADHATSEHGYDESASSQDAEAKLQPAVFDGGTAAYVGDEFDELPDEGGGKIRVPGPGFVLKRYESAATLDCRCVGGSPGANKCKLTVTGGLVATCENDTCTSCGFEISVPTTLAPDELLKADWLFQVGEPR